MNMKKLENRIVKDVFEKTIDIPIKKDKDRVIQERDMTILREIMHWQSANLNEKTISKLTGEPTVNLIKRINKMKEKHDQKNT
ncbi:hypothetical protein ES705_22051 [subsurface metagenome]